MIGVPHCGFEVDEAIETPPVRIQSLTALRMASPVFGEIAGAMIRRQGAADNDDAMGMRA